MKPIVGRRYKDSAGDEVKVVKWEEDDDGITPFLCVPINGRLSYTVTKDGWERHAVMSGGRKLYDPPLPIELKDFEAEIFGWGIQFLAMFDDVSVIIRYYFNGNADILIDDVDEYYVSPVNWMFFINGYFDRINLVVSPEKPEDPLKEKYEKVRNALKELGDHLAVNTNWFEGWE